MICIIPARSGSTRLKNKNISKLGDKPLLFHTIDAFLGHTEIKEIIFTTDSEDYIDLVSEAYGEKVSCLLRPKEYASNTTKVVEEITRILNLKGMHLQTDKFIMGLPTSPLRSNEIVKDAIHFHLKYEKPIFSATEYDFPVQFAFEVDETSWKEVFADSPMVTGQTRSQDIKKLFRPNGAIYINNAKNFLEYGNLYAKCAPFIMDQYASVDVDNALDFKFAEVLLKEKSNVQNS